MSTRKDKWKVGVPRPASPEGAPEKLLVTLEQDEMGMYVAECPAIPGCVSQGANEQEALENIRQAVQLCLQAREELGLPLTVKTFEIEVAA